MEAQGAAEVWARMKIGYVLDPRGKLITWDTKTETALGRPCKTPLKMEQGLNFGQALDALKAGKRACRAGWNGKGMWIALTPGSSIPASVARTGHAVAHLAKELVDSDVIRMGARIDMKAIDGSMVIGWLASHTDLLAEDWCVLD